MDAAPAEPPSVSVVIPVYGAGARLGRCLEAVERELAAARPALRGEIVVADDATPGGLPETLRSRHPRVRWVRGRRNLGFGGNANRGVRAACGDVVCLLNSDMYVAPGWFDDCLAAFDDPAVFAVSGRIREPGLRNDGYKELVFEGARAEVRGYPDPHPLCDAPATIPYASGGGSFFRRRAFAALGGFDPAFAPYYWEDVDLGWRAWRHGYRILYDPRHRLDHDHQGTIGAAPARRVRRIYCRGQRLFVLRHQTRVCLPRLLWRTSLWPALSSLLRLRIRHAAVFLADVGALPGILRARRAAPPAPPPRRGPFPPAAPEAAAGP